MEPSHVRRPLKTLLGVLLLLTLAVPASWHGSARDETERHQALKQRIIRLIAVHPDDTLRILVGAWGQGLFLLHLD